MAPDAIPSGQDTGIIAGHSAVERRGQDATFLGDVRGNPTGGSLLTRDPPVRGRDTFGSPSRSVLRTISWFGTRPIWGQLIGVTNHAVPRQVAAFTVG